MLQFALMKKQALARSFSMIKNVNGRCVVVGAEYSGAKHAVFPPCQLARLLPGTPFCCQLYIQSIIAKWGRCSF